MMVLGFVIDVAFMLLDLFYVRVHVCMYQRDGVGQGVAGVTNIGRLVSIMMCSFL